MSSERTNIANPLLQDIQNFKPMPTTSLEMNNQFRRKSLFYIALIIIGMILLAASLTGLHFQPGSPVPGAETSQESTNPGYGSDAPVIDFHLVLRFPLVLIFTILLILIIFRLVKTRKNYKQILKLAGGLLAVLCLFLLLNQIEFASPAGSSGDSQGTDIPPTFIYDMAPIGDPPKEMFWFVTIALIIGAVFLIMWLLFQALHQPKKYDLIADEAGAALKAIESGCDLRNVIIRCYMQMLSIAEEEQGIKRLNSMTPREFECIVTAKGIPYPPIHQLTTLFEKVRYGSKPTSPSDERVAIECLSAIQLSCISGDGGFK